MLTCSERSGEIVAMSLTFNQENFDKLHEQNLIMKEALEHVINSCVHPKIAMRAVMVDLEPIRSALKKSNELFGS